MTIFSSNVVCRRPTSDSVSCKKTHVHITRVVHTSRVDGIILYTYYKHDIHDLSY